MVRVRKKTCMDCGMLVSNDFLGNPIYTCGFNHFDGENNEHVWFAESGIVRPNKTVKQAIEHCPVYKDF